MIIMNTMTLNFSLNSAIILCILKCKLVVGMCMCLKYANLDLYMYTTFRLRQNNLYEMMKHEKHLANIIKFIAAVRLFYSFVLFNCV
jgi:hypothetical protein